MKHIIEKEVNHLTEEDYKKIFPEEYYSKYSSHLKILQFQKQVFQKGLPKKSTIKFSKRNNTTQKPTQIQIKTKINKNDMVLDTISKNKEEHQRMSKFVKNLKKDMKQGPGKIEGVLRGPLIGFRDVGEEVLGKLSFIENNQYKDQMKQQEKKKDHTKQYVSFTKAKTMSTSKLLPQNTKIRIDSCESINNYNISGTMQLHPLEKSTRYNSLTKFPQSQIQTQSLDQRLYKQEMKKVVNNTKSKLMEFNPEEKSGSLKYIMTMNSGIKEISQIMDQRQREKEKEKGKRVMEQMSSGLIDTKLGRTFIPDKPVNKFPKNLLEDTSAIKKIGQSIPFLSKCSQLQQKQKMRQFIQNI